MSKVTDRTLDSFRADACLNNIKYFAIASGSSCFLVCAEANVVWHMLVANYKLNSESRHKLFVHNDRIEYRDRTINLHDHVSAFMRDMQQKAEDNESDVISVRDIVELAELHLKKYNNKLNNNNSIS